MPIRLSPFYISLRHLPLLRAEGPEYMALFCRILSGEINRELNSCHNVLFPISRDVGALFSALEGNAIVLNRRIVLLFDDAAHIGRERPLVEFFDIFRTISTSRVSCKASIYPGVTKFGVRFDVFNDATVIEISRDERKAGFEEIFEEIIKKRFPSLAGKVAASRSIGSSSFGRIMGRAVTGNLRSFVYACNYMQELSSVGYPELTQCMLYLSGNYFWPLLEEVAPKLAPTKFLLVPRRRSLSSFSLRAPRKASVIPWFIVTSCRGIRKFLRYSSMLALCLAETPREPLNRVGAAWSFP
jgi:hypothetical protein